MIDLSWQKIAWFEIGYGVDDELLSQRGATYPASSFFRGWMPNLRPRQPRWDHMAIIPWPVYIRRRCSSKQTSIFHPNILPLIKYGYPAVRFPHNLQRSN